jgi:hypothetical protein
MAPGLMTARMYSGWREIRAGLTKNASALHPRPARHLASLLLPLAGRRPWAAMVVSAGGRAVAGQNPAYGLLGPLARVVLAGFYLESRYRARAGLSVTWKGRPVGLQYQGRTADPL